MKLCEDRISLTDNALAAPLKPTQQIFAEAFFQNPAWVKLAQTRLSKDISEHGFQSIQELKALSIDALYYFFSNQFGLVSEQHLKAPALLLDLAKNINESLINPPESIHLSELLNILPTDGGINLQELIAQCKHKNFALNLVEQAVVGLITLPSPFSSGLATCQESYEVAPDLNCLRFCDGHNSFFLIQLLSSADGLYFPSQNLLLSLAHINETHIHRLQLKLLADFAKSVIYANSTNQFAGIIASHSRPSHFYYDVWPALYELATHTELLEKIPTIIMRYDHDFADFNTLFAKANNQVLESSAIDQLAINHNQWFIHVGRHQHLSNGLAYHRADSYLLEKALQTPNIRALQKASHIADCYPVIWLGVEGQKRCWLEQIEGYAYLINQLAKRYPNLGVIFDGWTMPFTPSDKSKAEAEKDHFVSKSILNLLESDIKHVSVIGETSNTKLFVGNLADFFISNFSTGSIHISRFLDKSGFCHLSKRFSETALRYAMHIHPNQNVYLLPKEYINDQDFSGDTRHDYLSYSIDKEVFYDFIRQRLPKLLKPTNSLPIRFFIEPSYGVTYDLRVYLKMATHGNVLNIGAGEDKVLKLADYPLAYLQRELVYGTFPFGADKKIGLTADYLLWLRHPLPRVCFHANELKLAAAHRGQTVSISGIFATKHKVLDNYYTRILSGAGFSPPFGKCTEQMLLTAVANLKSRFIFIGMDEHPSTSYDLLCDLLDWDRSLFADTAPVRYEFDKNEFSDDELALAKAHNSLDLRLFEVALAIFHERLKQYRQS